MARIRYFSTDEGGWPSAPPLPSGGTLDLWLVRVGRLDGGAIDLSVLDRGERASFSRFVRDADRVRYAAAHVTLRRLLGAYTGVAPRAVRFGRERCPCCGDPHGRPVLACSPQPLHFSLSHSGDAVLVGVAAVPVGVDVELVPALAAVDGLGSALHPSEWAELSAVPARLRARAFARVWVRKEAYLKGLGTGLGRAPELDYVGTGVSGAVPPRGWTILDVEAPDGYAAGAAVKGPVAPTAIASSELAWPAGDARGSRAEQRAAAEAEGDAGGRDGQ